MTFEYDSAAERGARLQNHIEQDDELSMLQRMADRAWGRVEMLEKALKVASAEAVPRLSRVLSLAKTNAKACDHRLEGALDDLGEAEAAAAEDAAMAREDR